MCIPTDTRIHTHAHAHTKAHTLTLNPLLPCPDARSSLCNISFAMKQSLICVLREGTQVKGCREEGGRVRTGLVLNGLALLPRGRLDPGLPQRSPALSGTVVSPGSQPCSLSFSPTHESLGSCGRGCHIQRQRGVRDGWREEKSFHGK